MSDMWDIYLHIVISNSVTHVPIVPNTGVSASSVLVEKYTSALLKQQSLHLSETSKVTGFEMMICENLLIWLFRSKQANLK